MDFLLVQYTSLVLQDNSSNLMVETLQDGLILILPHYSTLLPDNLVCLVKSQVGILAGEDIHIFLPKNVQPFHNHTNVSLKQYLQRTEYIPCHLDKLPVQILPSLCLDSYVLKVMLLPLLRTLFDTLRLFLPVQIPESSPLHHSLNKLPLIFHLLPDRTSIQIALDLIILLI